MLAFGWNHPVTHAVTTAVAITLAARAIAGEVEHGVIELIMAQPISRTRYFMAHATFGVGAIGLVAGSGIAGSVAGRHLFALIPLSTPEAWHLFVNLVLLQSALYAITLLVSAFGREGGQVAIAGVLLAVISYLIDVVATMWSRAALLRPYSLHHYYDPRLILTDGHPTPASFAVLTTCVLVAGGAAFLRFQRRDLP